MLGMYLEFMAVNPAKVRRQKDRLRNHAKWQALVRLEQNKGCVPELSGTVRSENREPSVTAEVNFPVYR